MAKKLKLEKRDVTKPVVPNDAQRYDLQTPARCEATGVVVGTRPASGDFSQLYIVDANAQDARLLSPIEANLAAPAISPDGSRVAVRTAGPPGILEMPTSGGKLMRIWDGFIPPDGNPIQALAYAGSADRLAVFTGFSFSLVKRAGATIELESTLGSAADPIKGFAITPAHAGRVILVQHTTKQTLVGLVKNTLVVLAELGQKKGRFYVHGGRVYEQHGTDEHREITNLDEICRV